MSTSRNITSSSLWPMLLRNLAVLFITVLKVEVVTATAGSSNDSDLSSVLLSSSSRAIASTSSVASTSSRLLQTTCTTQDDCITEDEVEQSLYCEYDTVGMCSGPATCQPIPFVCVEMYQPVCGCDGKTYSNACIAKTVGESIADPDGPCVVPCTLQVPCGDPDHYCYFEPETKCGTVGGDGDGSVALSRNADGTGLDLGVGRCIPKPTSCEGGEKDEVEVAVGLVEGESASPSGSPTKSSLVCGCDGSIYLNECRAALIGGVSIHNKGTCPEVPCPAADGSECPFGDDGWCDYPDGSCGEEEEETYEHGVCRILKDEQECIALYRPVCGCDGLTYDNGCYAQANGVSVRDPDGPCPPSPPPTTQPTTGPPSSAPIPGLYVLRVTFAVAVLTMMTLLC